MNKIDLLCANMSALKKRLASLLAVALLGTCVPQVGDAVTAPRSIPLSQDNWLLEKTFGTPGAVYSDLKINSAGEVVAANSGSGKYEVYSRDGTFLRSFYCANSGYGAHKFSALADGNYACSNGQFIVLVDANGVQIRQLTQYGNNAGNTMLPSALAQLGNGEIAVFDYSRTKILILHEDGSFVREFGNSGTLYSNSTLSTIDNIIYTETPDSLAMQALDDYGNVQSEAQIHPDASGDFSTSDGKVYFELNSNTIQVYSPIADAITGLITSDQNSSVSSQNRRFYFAGDNDALFAIGADFVNPGIFLIFKYSRAYRTASSLFVGSPPEVRMLDVAPRAGTQITDISYEVLDLDSPIVSTGALAFSNGTRDLGHALQLKTLTDGTAANLGSNIPTGVQKMVSWNAGADLGSGGGFVAASVSIFANDNRGILDLHFITIPANIPTAGLPALTISDTPLRQSDFLEAWFWLIATNDPSISFDPVNGVVKDLSNSVLANGMTTTSAGVDFLLAKVGQGVRQSTLAERNRARAGSTNASLPGNQYAPIKRVGAYPIAVNEVGFDTGASEGDGVWVAKP